MDYTANYIAAAVYFFFVAVGIAFVFWDQIMQVIQEFTPTPVFVLAAFMTAQAFWYAYFPGFFRTPVEYFQQYPERDYLKLNVRRLFSKSADIFAQQVFIILLVVFLRDAGLSLPLIIIGFTILFALLHIPLIVSEWGVWPAWAFGGAVIVFGLIFPIVILWMPYGFIYNIILHWLFYTVMSSFFWLVYAKCINSWKEKLRLLTADWSRRVVPLLLGVILYCLLIDALEIALGLLILIVALIELRVRLGFRTARGPIFYVHIFSGILLVVLLATFIYTGQDEKVALLTLTGILSITGILLLWRSVKTYGH